MTQFPTDQFGPEYIIQVSDPKLGMIGFAVIDNTTLGLGKGGIRMTPSVTPDEVLRLARTMTWKNALAGIPFGGAKSGIVWNPDPALSSEAKQELKKQFVQSFARALAPLLGTRYMAGPDVNTGETEMRWIVEATNNRQSTTGKPTELGGLPHELGSTGFGVFHATKTAAEIYGLPLNNATVAIEGFGNVGSFVFKFLEEAGAKIVAVSDSRGTIHSPNGLKHALLLDWKQQGNSVADFAYGEKLDRDAIFKMPVDILIPAAVTDCITEENYRDISAKIIVEGSNIPMRENIEDALWQKGIMIVPDFVANAGGVISSYAESANLPSETMFSMVEEKVVSATRRVLEASRAQNKNPRQVAYALAQEIVKAATSEETLTA